MPQKHPDMMFGMLRKNRSSVPGGIAIFITLIVLFATFRSRILPYTGEEVPAPPPPLATVTVQTEKPAIAAPKYEIPFTFSRGRLIPPKIWQIMLPRPGNSNAHLDPQNLEDTPGWLVRNPGYSYVLVGQREADDFISTHFSGPEFARIRTAWRALKNPGVKSDILRYLMLYIEGGIYTDVDTEALKSIDDWVPEKYRENTNVVIGIEWDQLDGGPWAEIPHRLQFCQWTIAAAPGRPLFMKMVDHTLDVLEGYAETYQTTLDRLELTSVEVMMSSGPASWTDVVLAQLKEFNPNITDVTDFSGMKPTGPRLTGDILILTIDGFGMGQPHSNSTNDGTIPEAALLKHKFRGSWRHSV